VASALVAYRLGLAHRLGGYERLAGCAAVSVEDWLLDIEFMAHADASLPSRIWADEPWEERETVPGALSAMRGAL
jgi:hypothetical protein